MRKLAEINFLFMQDYRQAVFVAIATDTAWFGFGKNEENDKNGKNDKKFLAIGEKVKPDFIPAKGGRANRSISHSLLQK